MTTPAAVLALCLCLAATMAFTPVLPRLSSKSLAVVTLAAKKTPESSNASYSKTKGSNLDTAVEKKNVEPKYIVALVVFLLAALWDKQFMHGGIFH